MPVARLLREQTIGETRWVALDERGVPVALYLERESDVTRAVIGLRLTGRVQRSDGGLGGAFVDLGPHGESFLRVKSGEAFNDGASVTVEVVAEARRGKLARVRVADASTPDSSGADKWRKTLQGAGACAVEDRPAGDSDVQAAFDDALAPTVALRSGGRMQAERTEALVAADIDTAGRTPRGSRAAAALAINLDAAGELARQIHLRGWGGLAVLDCVAPVDKAAGGQIRAAFLDAFRAISARQVKALAPSAFGLMEVSADWQLTPLTERINGADGREMAESLALAGLRQLETAARADRMGRLELTLPAPAHAWLEKSGLEAGSRLAALYGARLNLQAGQTETVDVRSAS